MQILMSKVAYDRIADRLAAMPAVFDVVTMAADGTVHRGDAPVTEPIDPEVFWISLDMYPAGMLPHAFGRILQGTSGKWTQVFSAGLDSPAFKSVMDKGVRITKSDAQSAPIAEYVMAHALSLLHPIERQRAAQVRRAWERVEFREIADTRWLMVGFGAIGREIAARLKPFGAHLTVVRRRMEAEPNADAFRPPSDLLALLPSADVVILACALNDRTRGMADAAFFEAMKPHSIFVNIARGGLVDEQALQDALARGRPESAVLDVFETEPLEAGAWVWDHPQVRATAHTSNAGGGVRERGDELFLENLRRYRAGEALRNEASPSEVGL